MATRMGVEQIIFTRTNEMMVNALKIAHGYLAIQNNGEDREIATVMRIAEEALKQYDTVRSMEITNADIKGTRKQTSFTPRHR